MSSSSSDDDHSSENQQQNENVFGRHSEVQKDGQLVERSILQPPPKQRVHKKYGKIIVFCQKPIFISIGPDYWCFIPAFIIFSIAAYYLTKFVITNTKSVWFQSLTLLICGGFIFSYLAVAISNPGVVTQNQINLEQQNEMKKSRPRQCEQGIVINVMYAYNNMIIIALGPLNASEKAIYADFIFSCQWFLYFQCIFSLLFQQQWLVCLIKILITQKGIQPQYDIQNMIVNLPKYYKYDIINHQIDRYMGNSQAKKKKKQEEDLKKLEESQKKIGIAVYFLEGQNVKNIPEIQKKIFLRKKGLTQEMVDEAFKRFRQKNEKKQNPQLKTIETTRTEDKKDK